jgi:hypothetical protein
MASTKYIGYLCGAAIAAGVGAAIAVAGAATASAETTDSEAKAEPAKTEHHKPLQNLADRIEKVTAQATKSTSSTTNPSTVKPNGAQVSATQVVVKKPKPNPQEFEAEQVERLKKLFHPREGATQDAAKAGSDVVTEAEEPSAIPNPFGANDPDPVGIPAQVVQIRDQLVAGSPEQLQPFVREGVEQAYRATQMVPWVNALVPISKIAPQLGDALNGDKVASQHIVNELLKTTPPGGALYYGYDIVADLANQEQAGMQLKEDAFATAWNLLDPFDLLHEPGRSGIEGDRPPGLGSAL